MKSNSVIGVEVSCWRIKLKPAYPSPGDLDKMRIMIQ